MMRVAIPEADGRVERVFDCATRLVVIDFEDDGRSDSFSTPLRVRSMKNRARELAAMGVAVLLCNEISHALESLITAHGIEVRSQHSGRVDEIIENFFDSKSGNSRSPQGRVQQPAAVS
jgi:predicted Fe-Mo cluster-binding NifX family protein